MTLLPVFAFVFAALEFLANWKDLRWLELIAKPAVMICLFAWLYTSTELDGAALWFGMGVLFCLAGDVLLLWPDRLFIYGLAAFLLAHISYIVGFKDELTVGSAWSMLMLVIIALSAVRVMLRLVAAIRAGGQTHLLIPVVVYASIISIMLFTAMSTLSDLSWKAGAALSVSVGAFLFYVSDAILAWNKFVSPVKHGRLLSIAAYHLGQIGLIAGVISQLR